MRSSGSKNKLEQGRRRAYGLSAVLLILLMALGPLSARAQDWTKAPVHVQVVRDKEGHSYLTGGFSLQAPAALAWAVLSDYDRIDDFVESLDASWVASRQDGRISVGQEGTLSFLFFRKKVSLMLDIREEPEKTIQFDDQSGEDFEVYVGAWEIIAELDQIHVLYRLVAKPNFMTPPLVSGSLIKSNVSSLLKEVRAEIMRRAAEGKTPAN